MECFPNIFALYTIVWHLEGICIEVWFHCNLTLNCWISELHIFALRVLWLFLFTKNFPLVLPSLSFSPTFLLSLFFSLSLSLCCPSLSWITGEFIKSFTAIPQAHIFVSFLPLMKVCASLSVPTFHEHIWLKKTQLFGTTKDVVTNSNLDLLFVFKQSYYQSWPQS